MRIAVIGSTGQLGTDLVDQLARSGDHELLLLPHERLDVTQRDQVHRAVAGMDVVINCAAFVRVDACEENPDPAVAVNTLGALHVAEACAAQGALCTYISTDYVFRGDKGTPYTENDRPNPINVYGATKAAGELMVQQAAPRWLILRIASVFGAAGARGKGGNFIEAILQQAKSGHPVRVVADQWMSPTYTRDVAHSLETLLRNGATGLFHAANTGRCSWYAFAAAALQMAGLDVAVEPIAAADLIRPAKRPQDASLACEQLAKITGPIPPWEDALHRYLVEKGHQSA